MAHDDIDQIAASSRLSIHDPKTTNTLGNQNMAENQNAIMSHMVGNGKIVNSMNQHKGSSRPIILADNTKTHNNFGVSPTNYQQQKQNEFDRIAVDVSKL